MALRPVHIELTHPDQVTPARGVVRFTTDYPLRDVAGKVVHGPTNTIGRLVDGEALVDVPPNDDPTLDPADGTTTVVVDTDAWRTSFEVVIPAGSGPVEFSDLVEVETGTPANVYVLASQLAAQLAPYLPRSGGTMTGPLTLAGSPTQDLHAATRRYVLDRIAEVDVGGGGVESPGASVPIVRRAYITSGNVNPFPDTAGSWVRLSGFELSIPAAVGDDVELTITAMRTNTESAFLDAAVIVGTSVVRYLGTGTASPPIEGDPGWYPGAPGTHYPAVNGPRGFTVEAGHLDGDAVRFVLMCRASGAGQLYASTAFPFYWRALNRGVVA